MCKLNGLWADKHRCETVDAAGIYGVRSRHFIFFQPGTHTETMSLAFDDFAHLVHPAIAEFSLDEVVHI